MTDKYQSLLDEYNENIGTGYYPNEIMTARIMELERLDRIASALEGIETSLDCIRDSMDNLDKLADCIGYIPPTPYQKAGYRFFRICGSVETDQ